MTLDPGFRQDGVLVVNIDLRRAGVPVGQRRRRSTSESSSACARCPASRARAGVHRAGERQRLEQPHRHRRRARSRHRQLQQRRRRLLPDDGDAARRRPRLRRARHAVVAEGRDRQRVVRAHVLRRTRTRSARSFQIEAGPGSRGRTTRSSASSRTRSTRDLREPFTPLGVPRRVAGTRARPVPPARGADRRCRRRGRRRRSTARSREMHPAITAAVPDARAARFASRCCASG